MNVLNGLDLHIQSAANSQTDGQDDTVVCFIKSNSQRYLKFEDIFDYAERYNEFDNFYRERYRFESKWKNARFSRTEEDNNKSRVELMKEWLIRYYAEKTLSAKEISETVCND